MSYSKNIITISFSENHAKLLRSLKKDGYFPSMGSVVRYCINYTIPKLLPKIKQLDTFIENHDVIDVIKTLKEFGYIIHRGNQPRKEIPMLSINQNGENIPLQ